MQTDPCRQCGKPVPPGHRFCGHCGAKTDEPRPWGKRAGPPETIVFEPSPVKRKARLILLRGNGGDGASFHLNSSEHLCGRDEGVIPFPDDPTVSPRHCTFYYRDGHLYLADEGSANGTYIRLRSRIPLQDGDRFLCGEQIFDFRVLPDAAPEGPAPDTAFSGTPQLWPWRFQVSQLLTGGRYGEVRCVEGTSFVVGREEADLDFPHDRFMSHHHSRVLSDADRYWLEDAGSKNGTFYRIRGEVGLQNGDYLFVGRQLIRVEIS